MGGLLPPCRGDMAALDEVGVLDLAIAFEDEV